jgi:D-aminoacyl-tRNA deacylase
MELLVAYRDDPAGYNMAKFLSQEMTKDGEVYRGEYYDLLIISTPVISADWLEEKYCYDGFIFLSKHASESGILALTCHSTGNFATAQFGGNNRQIAIPHPYIQKEYLQTLWTNRSQFSDFQITIEATHHGPTALTAPTIFIEIGTTEKQWTDISLCNSVARLIHSVLIKNLPHSSVAICFGGTHYSEKFTSQLLEGKFSLGTVVPKHALDGLDETLFSHILAQNKMAKTVLLDWNGLGSNKQKVLDLINNTDLEVVKL